jgi:hypothetical protein
MMLKNATCKFKRLQRWLLFALSIHSSINLVLGDTLEDTLPTCKGAGNTASRGTSIYAACYCAPGLYLRQTASGIGEGYQKWCYECPIGMYRHIYSNSLTIYQHASTSCFGCPVGRSTTTTGSWNCTDCEVGYYSHSTEGGACIPCESGKYSSTTASVDAIKVKPHWKKVQISVLTVQAEDMQTQWDNLNAQAARLAHIQYPTSLQLLHVPIAVLGNILPLNPVPAM